MPPGNRSLTVPCRECGVEVPREALTCPECSAPRPACDVFTGEGYEWKSRGTWMGSPLVHVAFGLDASGRPRKAQGVIAIGQHAVGGIAVGIYAFGFVAVGLVAIGLGSCGVVAIAAVAACGVNAVGPVAIGVTALGWAAHGLAVFTWK